MRVFTLTFVATSLLGLGLAQFDVSPDGSCGPANGYSCLGSGYGNCCSNSGECGGTDEVCGAGCLVEFGLCGRGVGGLDPTSPPGNEPTTTRELAVAQAARPPRRLQGRRLPATTQRARSARQMEILTAREAPRRRRRRTSQSPRLRSPRAPWMSKGSAVFSRPPVSLAPGLLHVRLTVWVPRGRFLDVRCHTICCWRRIRRRTKRNSRVSFPDQ